MRKARYVTILALLAVLGWSASDKRKREATPTTPDFSQDATVVSRNAKQLVLKTDDGRLLTVSLDARTVWQKDEQPITAEKVHEGTWVHLEAYEDGEAFLTAATVNVLAEKRLQRRPPPEAGPSTTPKSPSADAEPTDQPPDDPDRPRLRRGKPVATNSDSGSVSSEDSDSRKRSAPKKQSGKEIDFTIEGDSDQTKLSTGVPTLVATTMEWVQTFTQGLPNFLCQQVTTRYAKEDEGNDWRPQDVISAKIAYEDGKESYGEIMVGNKRVNKDMMALGGTTSTGEFASTLQDLFSSATAAQFQFSRSTSINNTPVAVYHFNVDLDHSHWTIKVGSQQLHPVFSGLVWIEKDKGQVRKVELQADQIPGNFPMRNVFTSVAWDPVRLGTNTFLLPTIAVNGSCARKSSLCTKNDVEWRDYHRFSGESTITFH